MKFIREFNQYNKELYFISNDDTILSFNITKEDLNRNLYNDKGNPIGSYGLQYDDNKNYLEFNSIVDAQKWYDNRIKSFINKKVINNKYPDLSKIGLLLRNEKRVSFQDINRGSCFKFAKEISKIGYNKFTFIFSEEEQEVIHVYVKLSSNLYWDVIGFHKKSEVKSDYEIGEDNEMYDSDIDELNHLSNIDTYQGLTTIEISNKDWNIITKIIKSVK